MKKTAKERSDDISQWNLQEIADKLKDSSTAENIEVLKKLIETENEAFANFCKLQQKQDSILFMKAVGKLSIHEKIVDYLEVYLEYYKRSPEENQAENFETFFQNKQASLKKNLSDDLYSGDSALRKKVSLATRSTYFEKDHQKMLKTHLTHTAILTVHFI